jgi:hypothetical protein
MLSITQKDIERFWGRVDKDSSPIFYNGTRCWEWVGASNNGGYGVIKINGKQCYTHRISYLLDRGDIPDGLDVLHRCDNTYCVRPEHLFPGTDQDNVDDKVRKGRAYYPGPISPMHGETHALHKLSAEQVSEIRQRYGYKGKDGATAMELANEFGLSESQVFRIVKGESWK